MKKGRRPNAHGGKYNKPPPQRDSNNNNNKSNNNNQIQEMIERQEDMLNYYNKGRTKDLPQLFVSADSQDLIQDLLHDLKPNSDDLSAPLSKAIASNPCITKLQNELIDLGFRRDHVEQGIYFISQDPRFPKISKYTSSNLPAKEYNDILSATLDWLCLHIKEADLPRGFAPLNRIETVHFATPSRPTYNSTKSGNDSQPQFTNESDDVVGDLSLVQSFFITKMANYGFTRKSCYDALNEAKQNEDEALWILLRKLSNEPSSPSTFIPSEEDLITQREEESFVLESIFGNDFERRSSTIASVKIQLFDSLSSSSSNSDNDNDTTQLEIYFPPGCNYPFNFDPPIILFFSRSLLARTNFEITQKLNAQAKNMASNGETGGEEEPHVILYDLILWAQSNLPEIIEKLSNKNVPKVEVAAPVVVGPTKPAATALDFTFAKLEEKQQKEELEQRKKEAREAYLLQLLEAERNPGMKVEAPKMDFDVKPKKDEEEEKKKKEEEEKAAMLRENEQLEKMANEQQQKEQQMLEQQNKIRLQKLIKEMKIKEKLQIESGANEGAKLKSDLLLRMKQENYISILNKRTQLPAFQMREEILQTIKNNQVIVITGETGCGKTTQVPQFIMDEMMLSGNGAKCNMIITQPRRISAMSVADRVAEERCVRVGQEVGYQIRLEAKKSSKTRLLLCTTGIVLRKMQGHGKLEGVSHLIVDEVHERNLDDDFLLIILRDLLPFRPDLKVILMSATLNAELFSAYFGKCPMLHIPGRAYPVKEIFLEDVLEDTKFFIDENSPYSKQMQQSRAEKKAGRGGGGSRSALKKMMNLEIEEKMNEMVSLDRLATLFPGKSKATLQSLQNFSETKINPELVEALIGKICSEIGPAYEATTGFVGCILVFLPGIMEISSLYNMIRQNRSVFPPDKFLVLPLHSSLSSSDQRKVFERPPHGVRKIVLSTNIAETSVTIDDVVYVIDCGRMKENRYDPVNRMPQLVEAWESKANARQRKGRAGRVQEGICYRMYTSQRAMLLQDFQVPEMHRVPLEDLCLQIKLLDLGEISSFLGKAVEPPDATAITHAITSLEELDALDKLQFLTPLGYHLAQLPVDVRLGKMMLYGSIFRCLDPVLIIAAAMSTRDPFVSPSLEKRTEVSKVKKSFALGKSDHLTLLKAYKGWQNAKAERVDHSYCQKFFLDSNTLQNINDMKRQFVDLLSEIGFIPPHLLQNNNNNKLSKIISGGEYFNINSENLKLIKAVLCAGLYPNVIRVYPSPSSSGGPVAPKLRTRGGEEVSIHPVSVNFEQTNFESNYLIFHEKVKSTKVYVRDSTMITPYPLLLFGGDIAVQHTRQIISVDKWIEFACPAKTAVLIKLLRSELDKLLVLKIENPDVDISSGKTIDAIVQLLSSEFHFDLSNVQ